MSRAKNEPYTVTIIEVLSDFVNVLTVIQVQEK